ncbi:MAG: hypothetical protein KDB61_15490, partial [Planctomycetes bacterium]|nr:hypothetical protein [Planctomycetota bacterium]
MSGTRVILLGGGPTALIARMRGLPPAGYADQFEATKDRLTRWFREELAEFEGDRGAFERARGELQILMTESPGETRPGPNAIWWLALLPIAGILWLAAGRSVDQAPPVSPLDPARVAALAALRATPGYVVQGDALAGEGVTWTGLRDPLAKPWSEVIPQTPDELGVSVRWTPYHSLDPELVRLRVQQRLALPTGLSFELTDGTLVLRGEATAQAIREILARASAIPGVESLDTAALIDTDRIAIETESKALDGLILPFEPGSALLDRQRPLVAARLASLQELDGRVMRYGGSLLRLQVQALTGREEAWERALLERRVQVVRSALAAQGFQATVVETIP